MTLWREAPCVLQTYAAISRPAEAVLLSSDKLYATESARVSAKSTITKSFALKAYQAQRRVSPYTRCVCPDTDEVSLQTGKSFAFNRH
jgi:hypothetical protein